MDDADLIAKHGISKLDALIRAASGSARVPQTP